jgi:type II secretory pathway pseudopilin PulG
MVSQIARRTKSKSLSRIAMTLMEMVLVLIILATLAAIAVPLLSGIIDDSDAEAVVTKESMRVIRDVILGSQNQAGQWEDMNQIPSAFPLTLHDLFQEQKPAHMNVSSSLDQYDPFSKTGWNGPYLFQATGAYSINTAANFSSAYGVEGSATMNDGWGNPIVLQVDYDGNGSVNPADDEEAKYARLVSAGPNGVVDTPYDYANRIPSEDGATNLTEAESGDDIVIFLRVQDTRGGQ